MSKAKATAKTASKNNPVSRLKQREHFYKGKKITPVKFISTNRTFLAAEYETGDLVQDARGNILCWSEIIHD